MYGPVSSRPCVAYSTGPRQSSHACPAYLNFSPPTHPPKPEAAPPFPRGVRRGAPWRRMGRGSCDSRDVWSLRPLLEVTRVQRLGSREGAAGVVGCRCRCLSQRHFVACSLADVGCTFLEESKSKCMMRPGSHRLRFSLPVSRRSLFPFLSQAPEAVRFILWTTLLSPSSSRTRNLHRPARLNLSFFLFRGTGIRKGGGYFGGNPLSPYPSVKPMAALAHSEPTGGRAASSCLRVYVCV